MQQRTKSKAETLRALRALKAAEAVRIKAHEEVMVRHFTAGILDYFALTWAEMIGPCHSQAITEARRTLAYLLIEDAGLARSQVARLMERDHATTCHHYDRMVRFVADVARPEVATVLREVRALVSQRIRAAAMSEWQHQRFWRSYQGYVLACGRPMDCRCRAARYA